MQSKNIGWELGDAVVVTIGHCTQVNLHMSHLLRENYVSGRHRSSVTFPDCDWFKTPALLSSPSLPKPWACSQHRINPLLDRNIM